MSITDCHIAGVDEVGRGALAGPVVTAAVILPTGHGLSLADSKSLTPTARERIAVAVRMCAIDYAIGMCSHRIIDAVNIRNATLTAMQRAVCRLVTQPSIVHIDGNEAPELPYPARTIVRGDQTDSAIQAAAILAKTVRDRWMRRFDTYFPEYGFAAHKGYGTKAHCRALQHYGASPIHRMTFAPMKYSVTQS